MEDFVRKNRKFVFDVLNHLDASHFEGLSFEFLGFGSESGCYCIVTCQRTNYLGIAKLSRVRCSDFVIKSEGGLVRIVIYNPNFFFL